MISTIARHGKSNIRFAGRRPASVWIRTDDWVNHLLHSMQQCTRGTKLFGEDPSIIWDVLRFKQEQPQEYKLMVLPDEFDPASKLLERVVKGEAEVATATQRIQEQGTTSDFRASKSDLLIVKKREEDACECLRVADMSTGKTSEKYLADPFRRNISGVFSGGEAPNWFEAFRLSSAETIAAQVMYMTPRDARSLEALAPVTSRDVFVHTRIATLAEILAAGFQCAPEDVSFHCAGSGVAVDKGARLDSLFRTGAVEVRVKANNTGAVAEMKTKNNETGSEGSFEVFSVNGGLPLMDYSLREHPRGWEAMAAIASATGVAGFLLGLMTNIR